MKCSICKRYSHNKRTCKIKNLKKSKEDENEYIFEESDEDEIEIEKTKLINELCSIMQISQYKLLEYKKYYKNKSKIVVPSIICRNFTLELKQKYMKFLKS